MSIKSRDADAWLAWRLPELADPRFEIQNEQPGMVASSFSLIVGQAKERCPGRIGVGKEASNGLLYVDDERTRHVLQIDVLARNSGLQTNTSACCHPFLETVSLAELSGEEVLLQVLATCSASGCPELSPA